MGEGVYPISAVNTFVGLLYRLIMPAVVEIVCILDETEVSELRDE